MPTIIIVTICIDKNKRGGVFMYDQANCGIGAIVQRGGEKSHDIIKQGMDLLQALNHRGGQASDGTGDGCGILLQIPQSFFRLKYGIHTDVAVLMAFLPQDEFTFQQVERIIYDVIKQNGKMIIHATRVETNDQLLTERAKQSQPKIMQYFIDSELVSEAELFIIRRQIEKMLDVRAISPEQCSIVSFSKQTIVYKGLLTPEELAIYYCDLQDESFISTFCIVHQRFSTNTTPAWYLAQPFRYLAHNGEINTVSGNIEWANAKIALAQNKQVYPICDTRYSDSANLDRYVEACVHEGMSLVDTLARLLPLAYEQDPLINSQVKAYYEYVSLKQEAWDGPAGVLGCDGTTLVATLDRNGLRPFRVMQTQKQIILASEVGVLQTPLDEVQQSSRICASELLIVDIATGNVTESVSTKARLAQQHPYQEWLTAVKREVPSTYQHEAKTYEGYDRKFKYTKAEYTQELQSLVTASEESIGSFAHTAQLSVFQQEVGMFFDYFKQNFAQVTNPPLDSLREQAVFSTKTTLTSATSFYDEQLVAPVFSFDFPVITYDQYTHLLGQQTVKAQKISLQYTTTLQKALETLKKAIEQAVLNHATILVFDDEGVEKAIPSVLAATIGHQTLIKLQKRYEVTVLIRCADARLPIHFALLLAYGADLIYPYYAYEYVLTQNKAAEHTIQHYLTGCKKALLKFMAKIGISTVQSYRGSKVFTPVGLDAELHQLFHESEPMFGGMTIEKLDASLTHISNDYQLKWNEYQNSDSIYMTHAYSKLFIKMLKSAVQSNDYEQFLSVVEQERERHINLRDYFMYRFVDQPCVLTSSEQEILSSFVGSAMSYGALSLEAHTAIAQVFNELGASSNSGEGGELPERFTSSTNSQVKQVASGRFGVTYEYLRSAKEIQIKMAQGAKPGEGGHLPKQKVDDAIARARFTERGVNLISPPPHHDIYSIEDLAQLIYDVQTVQPKAIISVKLAALHNVGTIANGVVKAGAHKVVISGFNGGTGASAKSSLKSTGLPWEYGLYQTHKTLVENGVREDVILQVDGQIKSGYDIIAGAILGADEFGLGTMSLIGVDCIGCKMCHTNKCPKGITTQDERLREKFHSNPHVLKTYLQFLAKHTQELMAKLGVSHLWELRGRTDLLILPEQYEHTLHWLQPIPFIKQVKLNPGKCNQEYLSQEHVVAIINTQRTIGVQQVTGKESTTHTSGYAGQSYGAFLPTGHTLIHEGYANDYVGKGLSGGTIVLCADKTARTRFTSNSQAIHTHFIAGNTLLYGATSGTCFIEGSVGERFAVRNSGAVAVNHGMGVHACEYMTGGVVVCLGSVSHNIGAGMTGGLLFIYKPENITVKLNTDVQIYPIKQQHQQQLQTILTEYVQISGNIHALNILKNINQEIDNFVLITSEDYYTLSV